MVNKDLQAPVMPMWVDFNRGSVWSSGAFPPIEVVRLDGSQPGAASEEFRLV